MNKLNGLTYVDEAERVINSLITTDRNGNKKLSLTTSKIRNLLTMTNNLYTRAKGLKEENLPDDLVSDIKYLKMRFAYESGREKTVKEFAQRANILKYLDSIGNNKNDLIVFCHYMEALVAYHKFNGGRD